MKYEATKNGERNLVRIEVGADDLPKWDRIAAGIKGLLECMADAEGRRHRKMLPEDWSGIITNKAEGASEALRDAAGGATNHDR